MAENIPDNPLADVPDTSWDKLHESKIYFGHKSVGDNIVDGLKDLMAENPKIRLNIVETRDASDFNNGIFAHSSVGKNQDPASKIDHFAKIISSGVGEKADIAFFKFCYVDFNAGSDVDKIFNDYNKTISSLAEEYPELKIIHCTTPIRTVETGFKAWLKKLLGKPIGGYAENVKRNEYSDKIINTFQKEDDVFDLSRIESTFPNGKKNIFRTGGKEYTAMVPDYTSDGGHLNEAGRKKAAEALLLLLVNNI